MAAFASVAALSLFAGAATASSGTVIYDSTVSPLPGNLPSYGAEAYSFAQVGDEVTFAGTARDLRSVTVTLSSWGCQSGHWYDATCVTAPGAAFSVPITLNIYQAGAPTPGPVIATRTQTFNVPYRPSSDNANCTGGRWYQASTNTCFNGLAYNVTFDFTSSSVALPDTIVYGISYNTTNHGPSPIGPAACSTNCPYDSLNIALSTSVSAGTKPFPGTLYQDSSNAGWFCDSGAGGTGTFRLDSPGDPCRASDGWPAVQFVATQTPTTADQCKKGGWVNLTTATGTSFKNQGDCVSYVASNGKAKGNP